MSQSLCAAAAGDDAEIHFRLPEARKLAATLAAKAPLAVRYIIDVVNRGLEMPFAEAQAYEATLFGLIASTEDMREGTRAFLEKRKPEFKGK